MGRTLWSRFHLNVVCLIRSNGYERHAVALVVWIARVPRDAQTSP
jgi:hypothetical protein